MAQIVDFLPWLQRRIRRPRSGPFGRILAWVWKQAPVRHSRLLPAPAAALCPVLALPPPRPEPGPLLLLPAPER